MVLVFLSVCVNWSILRQHTHDNPCTDYFSSDDILYMTRKTTNKKRDDFNSMRHTNVFAEKEKEEKKTPNGYRKFVSLTFYHVTVPSVHFTYIHKHSIFIGIAICCTNRKIIVWTLTLTVDVLCYTNCLIGFCYYYCWCCWCCCRRFDAQNNCNHFRKAKKKRKEHPKNIYEGKSNLSSHKWHNE